MQALSALAKAVWKGAQREPQPVRAILYRLAVGFAIGVATGAIISVFRITTDQAYSWICAQARSISFSSAAIIFFCAIAASALVGFLVRSKAIRFGGATWIREALSAGSPHPWLKVLFPKFLGSWLVMAMGISVGREGPCIQMGAATALGLRHIPTSRAIERRFFILGGCASGLAAAFSAPFAGVCYVYEVMKERMTPALFAFMLAGGFGVYVSASLIFGLDVMLPMQPSPDPTGFLFLLVLPLALLSALVGIAYNYLLRISISFFDTQKLIPVTFRPTVAFMAAALMLLIFPAVTGEGLTVFEGMLDRSALAGFLLLFLIVKLLLTAFSYGTGIPAGLMVPILCLGGVMGGLYGDLLLWLGAIPQSLYTSFIVLGMGGAFAAAERAPITGLVLVCQMTGAWSLSAAMLIVTATATLCARIARVSSI